MSELFTECSTATAELAEAVRELDESAALLKLGALEGREWYELLRQKLVPQLCDHAYLVAAVVGGTNIGKSAIFNHIAGSRASETSPLASGTKHPVCLVPPRFGDQRRLADVFPGFELQPWSEGAPLRDDERHLLYWHGSTETPSNLLILDTPDIDSDAPVNWQRADHIRRAADVLIAVLTQQKYNDAAVKRFFRTAAAEDKVIIVVFNQCLLPEDEQYWPHWLNTFCHETGVSPEIVYLAPNDRRAAEENRLPFYERAWPVPAADEAEGDETAMDATHETNATQTESCGPQRNLREDLSRLRFAEIKLQTLVGSLRMLLDPDHGIPNYLREVSAASGRFQSAVELLSEHQLARLNDWPAVPNKLMIAEIRAWWQTHREGWSRKIHGFYNSIGDGLRWPFKFAREKLGSEQLPPMERYRREEWNAVLETVDKAYERLQVLADLGNPLLHDRLQKLLAGHSRAELIQRIQTAHQQHDLQEELEQVVRKEMENFQTESPRTYQLFSRLDKTAAVARPATSVVLFLTGLGPAGDVAAQLVTEPAIQTAVHVVGDVTGGTVAVAVGDSALSSGAASSMGYIEAKFRRLHATFTMRRVAWLMELLNELLWGALLQELHDAATVQQSPQIRRVQTGMSRLEELLRKIPSPETAAVQAPAE